MAVVLWGLKTVPSIRCEIVRRRIAFENGPEAFIKKYRAEDAALRAQTSDRPEQSSEQPDDRRSQEETQPDRRTRQEIEDREPDGAGKAGSEPAALSRSGPEQADASTPPFDVMRRTPFESGVLDESAIEQILEKVKNG